MNYRRFLGAASAALMMIVVTLIITPGAGAQSKYKTLYEFKSGKGGNPQAGLIFDAAGNLYGTTTFGGHYGFGVVFELMPNADGSWTEKVLHHFTGGKDGRQPYAGLIFDQAGSLYSTTYLGGLYGCGTAFELTPNADGTWKEKVLRQFNGKDGYQPLAGLIFDQAGNLYSTAPDGGAHGGGNVFELMPSAEGSWKERVLHNFTGGKDGANPNAGVILDGAGNLYATTEMGGASGAGTVFEIKR